MVDKRGYSRDYYQKNKEKISAMRRANKLTSQEHKDHYVKYKDYYTIYKKQKKERDRFGVDLGENYITVQKGSFTLYFDEPKQKNDRLSQKKHLKLRTYLYKKKKIFIYIRERIKWILRRFKSL